MKNAKIYAILALILCVAGNLNAQNVLLSPYQSPYLTMQPGVDVRIDPSLTSTHLDLTIGVEINQSLVSSVEVSDIFMGGVSPPPLNSPIPPLYASTGAHPELWSYPRRQVEYSMYIMFTVTYLPNPANFTVGASSPPPPTSFGCIVTVQPL